MMTQTSQQKQLPNVIMSQRKGNAIIQIKDEPLVKTRPQYPHEIIQDHSMMMFQQLIMKRGRAALRSKSLNVFRNALNVEIEIITLQPSDQFYLEKVLKAIFDGLNKHVIYDDRIINNAQVWLKQANKKYPNTIIKVALEDCINGNSISFNCKLPCIEKKEAVVYDIGGVLTPSSQSIVEQKTIEQALKKHASNVSGNTQYDICHMLFCTHNDTKDVDNMFMIYINAIRRLGLFNHSSNIGIGMYKRHAKPGEEQTIINLLSK
ncbi:hypothetical protein SAMN04488072_102175 [Lentibacillus halodurans]|uniref:Uncharacterized protein n=1 Tax=Lentibacillus halodurans TaxID=237679 RepID=A0A1I0W5E0_9BACI|nr:hypothetical protein [Lentibacillus halodurans]SFA83086.1 hypothetical protein SAMN04488072_102175 [Lentibacillus halodurans]